MIDQEFFTSRDVRQRVFTFENPSPQAQGVFTMSIINLVAATVGTVPLRSVGGITG